MKKLIENCRRHLSSVKAKVSAFLGSLESYQVLSLGFLSYVFLGVLFLELPFSQKGGASFVDNIFNAVSAMSTTGLTTGAISDIYAPFGLFVLLVLMQLGALGYMTITSFIILSRTNSLSTNRVRILAAEFPMPDGMCIPEFLRHIIAYTAITEGLGAALLWWRFSALGVPQAPWSAVFHSVSAFGTAGFSLYADGFSAFKNDVWINAIISVLCYAGAIGFIVPLDIYRRLRGRTKEITFTSKVILGITFAILAIGTLFCYFESDIGFMASFFQVMSASTTSGFNTVDIGKLSLPFLMMIMLVMVIGASPTGTGGGIKTTSVSVLLGIMSSVLRGEKEKISFMGRIIPPARIYTAMASTVSFMLFLFVSVLVLSTTEKFSFLELSFESASAFATVGLSMGITSGLTVSGKLVLSAVMFVGRVGLLTFGLSFFAKIRSKEPRKDDIVV